MYPTSARNKFHQVVRSHKGVKLHTIPFTLMYIKQWMCTSKMCYAHPPDLFYTTNTCKCTHIQDM